MQCKKCGSVDIRYPKAQLCYKCYMSDYNKQHYKKNAAKRKADAKAYYYSNHERCLVAHKEYRERRNFDGNRQIVLERDNYTCCSCGNIFLSSKLTVHHKDRSGRGTLLHNNELDNLVSQCRRCHRLEHNEELREAIVESTSRRFHWAIHYNKCIECGTTDRRHDSHGLCVNCAARKRKREKKMKI